VLGPTKVEIDGRILTSFAGTNYLGLSFHPRILAAWTHVAQISGLGMGASRKTTGTTAEVLALERKAARFAGTDEAIVTTSGTLANAGVIDGLRGLVDLWLVDAEAHASFKGFLPMSSAETAVYRHRDVSDLKQKLAKSRGQVGIFTDLVFPLTGDTAPWEEIETAAGDALCVFDAAHSFGMERPQPGSPRTIFTATFTKALGCAGGVILGGANWLHKIRERSAILASTSALSPPLSAAASEAITVVEDEPERIARLRSNIAFMAESLAIPCPKAPIFFRIERAQEASARALNAGFVVPLVSSYPGAPAEGILRWIVSSEHTRQEIRTVCDILGRL
jgi:7-keto-8-aminopelargonate synthetase-like enzyme